MQREILLAALGHPGSLIGPPAPPTPSGGEEEVDEGGEGGGDDGRSATVETPSPAAAAKARHHRHVPPAEASSSRPFRCTPLARRLLSPSECTSIDRIVAYGHEVRFLRWFVDRVDARSFGTKTPGPTSGEAEMDGGGWHHPGRTRDGRWSETETEECEESESDSDEEVVVSAFFSRRGAYVEAAAGTISRLLDDHERAVCRLERDLISSSSDLGLSHLGMEVEAASGWIPSVASLVRSLLGILGDEDYGANSLGCVATSTRSNDRAAGVVLLSTLDECLELTPPSPTGTGPHNDILGDEEEDIAQLVVSPRAALSSIRSAVCAVYTRQIAAWVVGGRLVDPHDEFFVVVPSRETAYSGATTEECEDEEDEGATCNDHVLRYSRLPPTVSPSLARKILFLGRAVRILREDDDDAGSDDDHRWFRGHRWRDVLPSSSPIATASAEGDFAVAAKIDLERTVEKQYSRVSVRLHSVLMGGAAGTENDEDWNDCGPLLLRQLNVLHNVFLSGDGRLIPSFLDRCDAAGLWTRRIPFGSNGGSKAAAVNRVGGGDGHGHPQGYYPDFHNDALLPVLCGTDDPMFSDDAYPNLYPGGGWRCHRRRADGLGSYGSEIMRGLRAVVAPRRFEYHGGRTRGPSSSGALFRPDYDLRTSGSARVVTGRSDDSDGGGCIVLSSSGDGDEVLRRRWWNSGDDDPSSRRRPVVFAEEGKPSRPGCVYTMRKRTLGRGFETSVSFRFLPPSPPSSTIASALSRSSRGRNGTTSSGKSPDGGGALCVVLTKDRPSYTVLSALAAVSNRVSRSKPNEPTPLRRDGAGDDRSEESAVVVAVRHLLAEEGRASRVEVTIDGEEESGAILDVVDPNGPLTLTVGWDRRRHNGRGGGGGGGGSITANLRVEDTSTTRMVTTTTGGGDATALGSGYASASVKSRPFLLRDRLHAAGRPRRARRRYNDDPVIEAHVAIAASGAECVVRRWSLDPGFVSDSTAKGAALEMATEAAVTARGASYEPKKNDHEMTETTKMLPLLKRVHDEVMAKLSWIDDGGGMQLAFEYTLPRRPLLSLVMSSDALRDYQRFFDRIFPAQLCLHELRDCWSVMMIDGGGRGGGEHRLSSSPSTNPPGRRRSWELRFLWALRARMEFVVGNILRYYQVDVSLSALHELSAEMKSSEDVDHVLAAHARYIATLRRRCFLVGHNDDGGGDGGTPSLAAVLGRMTAQVLRFSGLVRRGGVGVTRSGSSGPMIAAKDIPLLRDETRRISRKFDDELSNLLVLLRRHDETELCHRLDFSGWLSSRMAAK